MAKKKPRKKKRVAKRPPGPHVNRSVHPHSRDTWRLRILSGSRDRDAAWRYLEQFMVFEMAILNDRLGNLDSKSIPHEHRYLLSRWPEAFELFRHAMWSYAERAIGMNPWTSTLRSLMVRARDTDPAGFDRFETAISEALPRFQVQRNNVLHQIQDEKSRNARERHRTMVKLYADMYEVDFPLWVLGVLGRAYHRGILDPLAFGGPSTAVTQGSLVDAVSGAIADTPLAPLLDRAYIPALRNAVNHNTYEMRFRDGEGEAFTGVYDADSGQEWTAEELFGAWQATGDLINAAMSACASVSSVLVPSSQKQFADCGVVAINYAVIGDVPHAVVAQLWCFRDIDPDGIWLDSSEFIIEGEAPGVERAGFTSKAFMVGTALSGAAVGAALRDRGWIRVIRIPVAPDMDMGFPVFHHEVAGKYEVVGIPDEHDVPLRRATPWPRADILVEANPDW